jgi:hypothetical protein
MIWLHVFGPNSPVVKAVETRSADMDRGAKP